MIPASRPPNGFLASLSEDDFELLRPHLKTVDLTHELVLVEVDEALKRAYLPHRGIISLMVKLARGEHVQIAMVGRDSIFGTFSALGDATALNGASCWSRRRLRLDIDRLRVAADQSATLAQRADAARACGLCPNPADRRMQRGAHGGGAAGALPAADARPVRQQQAVLTQEAMAQMIGARRNSVSLVASTLQQANYIHYSRGHIEITNLDGWPDLLRMLCARQGAVRQVAAARACLTDHTRGSVVARIYT